MSGSSSGFRHGGDCEGGESSTAGVEGGEGDSLSGVSSGVPLTKGQENSAENVSSSSMSSLHSVLKPILTGYSVNIFNMQQEE